MPKITRHGGPSSSPPREDVPVQVRDEAEGEERPPPTKPFEGGEVSELPLFLNWLAGLGLLKPATVSSYQTAVGQVFNSVNADPRRVDVRDVDLDDWVHEFAEAREDLSGKTVSTYQTRFRRAVELYRTWLTEPESLRLDLRGRERDSRRAIGNVFGAPHHGAHVITMNYDAVIDAASRWLTGPTPSDLVVYPFPLADGTLGYLGLPHPLPRADAERLSAYVMSLAVDPVDGIGDGREGEER